MHIAEKTVLVTGANRGPVTDLLTVNKSPQRWKDGGAVFIRPA